MKDKMRCRLRIESPSFMVVFLSLAILLIGLGGVWRDASATVLFLGEDRQIAIPAPGGADVWAVNDRPATQTANQPTMLSLSVPPSVPAAEWTSPRQNVAAVTWSSVFEIAPDARRFTVNLVFQERSGDGLMPPPVGAVDLANSSPVVPLAPSPSSVLLFVPALVGLLGVILRDRSCAASSGTVTESVGKRPSEHSPCLLILSSDPAFSHEIQEQAHRAGCTTRLAADVHGALAGSEHASPALFLVDRRIVDWDMLRTSPSLKCVPLITLSPRGSLCTEEQWISDLDRGADGTHDFREGGRLFIAKVGAYLRRVGRCDMTRRGVYQMGAVELDADVHEVRVAGRPVPLSSKPFAILQTLMQAPSKVFSRHELIDRVWGPQFAIGDHTLDVHVHALRRQLQRDPNRRCQLVTIKGVGFKLKEVTCQIPVPKRVVRRWSGMPHRAAALSDLHTAALAG